MANGDESTENWAEEELGLATEKKEGRTLIEEKESHTPRTEVVERGKTKESTQNVVGTGEDNENQLEEAVRRGWIYIGKLKETTTSDHIVSFLENKGIVKGYRM